jgi:hypothetical protein
MKDYKFTAALAALFTPEANARNAGDAERVISKLLNIQTDEETKTNAAETRPEGRSSN